MPAGQAPAREIEVPARELEVPAREVPAGTSAEEPCLKTDGDRGDAESQPTRPRWQGHGLPRRSLSQVRNSNCLMLLRCQRRWQGGTEKRTTGTFDSDAEEGFVFPQRRERCAESAPSPFLALKGSLSSPRAILALRC